MASAFDAAGASDGPERAAVIVAHPDDETLWAGGFILARPSWDWTIVTLCRRSDPDRAPRFVRALAELGASGAMGDLDDGPDQEPLAGADVRAAVLAVLPRAPYDLVLTHSPFGEYTRHLRHEETARAVAALWAGGDLQAGELWMFAYADDARAHLPRAIPGAHVAREVPGEAWRRKRWIVEKVYGFGPESFEVRTCPREEAFWRFGSHAGLERWMNGGGR